MDPNFGVMPRPSTAVYPAGGGGGAGGDEMGPGAPYDVRRKIKCLTASVVVFVAVALAAFFMVMVLYTTSSISSRTVKDGSIETADLSDIGVTTEKLRDAAVTTAKVSPEAITAALIGSAAVTTAKIDNSAVTAAKIGTGAVTVDKLAASSVTTAAIGAYVSVWCVEKCAGTLALTLACLRCLQVRRHHSATVRGGRHFRQTECWRCDIRGHPRRGGCHG